MLVKNTADRRRRDDPLSSSFGTGFVRHKYCFVDDCDFVVTTDEAFWCMGLLEELGRLLLFHLQAVARKGYQIEDDLLGVRCVAWDALGDHRCVGTDSMW